MGKLERVGQIVIEHADDTNNVEYGGAQYLRDLVEWMNDRPEELNSGKSNIQLIREFNAVAR